MSREDFAERMRERMPAHRVWAEPTQGQASGVSRPANDALWEDMRLRLRSYQEERGSRGRLAGWRDVLSGLSRTSNSRTIAILAGALALLIGALAVLFR